MLKIDMHEHHAAKIPEKTSFKAQIKALKQERTSRWEPMTTSGSARFASRSAA